MFLHEQATMQQREQIFRIRLVPVLLQQPHRIGRHIHHHQFPRLVPTVSDAPISQIRLPQVCQVNERHTTQHEHQQEVGKHLLLTQCQHTKVRIPELLHLLCRQRPLSTRLHFRINILEQHRIVPLYAR